jgi:hypothetical protein
MNPESSSPFFFSHSEASTIKGGPVSKYAISIEENTLDLIQVLNGGVRPELEDTHSHFVFETDGTTKVKNCEIISHTDLYEGRIGHVGNGYVIQMVL